MELEVHPGIDANSDSCRFSNLTSLKCPTENVTFIFNIISVSAYLVIQYVTVSISGSKMC